MSWIPVNKDTLPKEGKNCVALCRSEQIPNHVYLSVVKYLNGKFWSGFGKEEEVIEYLPFDNPPKIIHFPI